MTGDLAISTTGADGAARGAPGAGGWRVLVVDDDENLLAGLRRELRGSYRVSTAKCAPEGLRELDRHGPFAVVIADVRMPGEDGLAFLGRVRRLAPTTVPMVLTGHVDAATAIRAVNDCGVFRFLSKPCPLATLRAALAAAVEQHRFQVTYPGANPDPVLQLCADGTLVFANEASAPLLAAWRSAARFAPPQEVTAAVSRALAEGRSQKIESEAGGRLYALTVTPLALPRTANVYATDITGRKVAEDELRKVADELGRSNRELEQFAYVASHDLQEPLRMVGSYAELLARRYAGRLDGKADQFLGFIHEGVERMHALIEGLLAYSRVGGPRRERRAAAVDCGALVDAVVAALRESPGNDDAVVTRDDLPTVAGVEAELFRLFQNLLGNAVKFRDAEAPRVHVSARREGGSWVFVVRDNGIGIPEDAREAVFGMLHRLHGLAEYPGTGMGLAICRRIVAAHGGRIWVEAAGERGTTVRFTLPARGVAATCR